MQNVDQISQHSSGRQDDTMEQHITLHSDEILTDHSWSDIEQYLSSESSQTELSSGLYASGRNGIASPSSDRTTDQDTRAAAARDRIKRIFVKGFGQVHCRAKIVHTIHTNRLQRDEGCLRAICEDTGYRGSVFIAVKHGNDHIHTVHDCTYSSRTCRCSRLTAIGHKYPVYSRSITTSSSYTIRHWVNCAVYFLQGTREYLFLQLGSNVWRNICEVRDLFYGRDKEGGQNQLVEDELLESRFLPQKLAGCSFNSQSNGSTTSDHEEEKNTTNSVPKIMQFFMDHPCSPPSFIFNSFFWNTHKYYKFDNPAKEFYQICLRNWCWQLCNWSILDFWNHYEKIEPSKLCFNFVGEHRSEYYFSFEESFVVLNDFKQR